jgi:hypothetical protein
VAHATTESAGIGVKLYLPMRPLRLSFKIWGLGPQSGHRSELLTCIYRVL